MKRGTAILLIITTLCLISLLSSKSVSRRQLELPLFIEGTWVGYPVDSSFKSVLTYRLSPKGRYFYAENELFNKSNELFRTYEGMYFTENDTLRYHLKGPGNESHSGFAILDGDSLTHSARVSPGTSVRSYISRIIKTDENQFRYFAKYSTQTNPPKELELVNPIIYSRIRD